MRIGLFGIPGTGKKNAVNQFMKLSDESGKNFSYVSIADRINEEMLGDCSDMKSSSELTAFIDSLRKEIDESSDNSDIIIDENYCFIIDERLKISGYEQYCGYIGEKIHLKGSSHYYNVVLPRFELLKYDLIVIMDADSKVILNRLSRMNNCGSTEIITKEMIDEWKYVEMSGVCCTNELGDDKWWVVYDCDTSGQQLWDGIMCSASFGRNKQTVFYNNSL